MRTTFWCASLIASSVVAGTAVLHAAARPGGLGHTPPHGMHGDQARCELAQMFHAHMQHLHSELNLTEAQRDAVHAELKANHGALAAAVRPILQAKRKIINAVHADTTDEAAIRMAADSLGKSVGDAAIVIARVKVGVLRAGQLTPEQTRRLGEIQTRVDAAIGHMLDALQPPAENPR